MASEDYRRILAAILSANNSLESDICYPDDPHAWWPAKALKSGKIYIVDERCTNEAR